MTQAVPELAKETLYLLMNKHGDSFEKARASSDRSNLWRKATFMSIVQKETTLLEDLREFSSDTSAHGIKYVFESPRKIVRVLFLLMWVAVTVIAATMICTKLIMFCSKPTGTKFEVALTENKDANSSGIKFPTISVCSLNKVRKSYLDDDNNKLIKEYFEIVDQFNPELLPNLTRRLQDEDDEMYSIRNRTYESLLEDGGPHPNRFVNCEQRGHHCTLLKVFENSEYSTMETTNSGKCWRVNHNGKLKGKLGDYGALKIAFWADLQDYSNRSADQENHGFMVVFHDDTSYGTTMFSGYLMSPGTYYKADMRLKTVTRNKDKALNCYTGIEHTTYGLYSEGACVMECKDKVVNESCGCVQILPPENNGKYKACTLEEWAECGLSTYMDWHHNYTEPTIASDAICSCDIPPCDEIKYETDISSSSISAEYVNSIYPFVKEPFLEAFSDPDYNISYTSPDDILKNLMVLEVLFNSLQQYQVNEVITYDLADLFGDVGGVLGLFLGASIFTIIEFMLFFIVSMAKYCCKATASGWLDVT